MSYSPEQISNLYQELSIEEKEKFSSLMDDFLKNRKERKYNNIMELAGCLANETDIKLTDEELDEAIRSFYLRKVI